MAKEVADPDGPHRLPYGEQERCVVRGLRIDGNGDCHVVIIRDRRRRGWVLYPHCLLYTSPSPRDRTRSRMPSSA